MFSGANSDTRQGLVENGCAGKTCHDLLLKKNGSYCKSNVETDSDRQTANKHTLQQYSVITLLLLLQTLIETTTAVSHDDQLLAVITLCLLTQLLLLQTKRSGEGGRLW